MFIYRVKPEAFNNHNFLDYKSFNTWFCSRFLYLNTTLYLSLPMSNGPALARTYDVLRDDTLTFK